ncbi:hypothetical protein [Aurantiacibacter luteus]|uniref:Uncharacterized protein n=1 Tax=Aurantiacibacter luteus TaxID=1581420 RepID=A0A0G9MYN1_9SPHN|nr:hypothetical protein [Aurantiacibacter luteus]KLE34388.1 hypothetical protein AAW00_09140 [Aurantiacibacter luteus]
MAMSDIPTRKERLAAKLRENLHRRKSQARGLYGAAGPQARKAERPSAGAAQPERSPGEANSAEDESAEVLSKNDQTR